MGGKDKRAEEEKGTRKEIAGNGEGEEQQAQERAKAGDRRGGSVEELKRCIVKVGRAMTAQSDGDMEEHQTDLSSFRRGSNNVGTSRNERCSVGGIFLQIASDSECDS